jgi:molybdopterin converting factor small subunit
MDDVGVIAGSSRMHRKAEEPPVAGVSAATNAAVRRGPRPPRDETSGVAAPGGSGQQRGAGWAREDPAIVHGRRTPVRVTVRYFAAARAAAGAETETVDVPPGATVDILLKTVRAAHGDALGRVLDRCSFLLDEVAVRDRDVVLHDGAQVDVLPPFAGG